MDAFEQAKSIRYLDDLKLKTHQYDEKFISNYEAGLALNSLKISKEITPDIYESLSEVCDALKLNSDQVKAYVTSSSEIQATCMSFNKEACIITLSSKILNLLSFEEIKFVMGHEIGHFLLSHNIEDTELDHSQESFIKKRAQEISVERIGLWACKDLNIATRAIVKTLSGLNEDYIRFDMQAFLKQLDDDAALKDTSGQFSTHPSFLIRAKALLRFSLSDQFQKYLNNSEGSNLEEIDQLIRKDLDLYIDKELRLDIKNSKEMVSFWGYAYAFVKKGSFSKKDQYIFSQKFGQTKKDKLINMIKDQSSDFAIKACKDRFFKSIIGFKSTAPNLAKKELNLLLLEIEAETKQINFHKEIIKDL